MADAAAIEIRQVARRGQSLPRRVVVPTIWVLASGLALALLPLPWLVLGLGGLLFLLLTAIRPYGALYLVAFAVPFGSLLEIGLGPLTVGATEALLAWMLASWVASRIALGGPELKLPLLAVPVIAFSVAALYSVLNASSLTLAAKELLKWVEVAAVIAFVYNAVPRRRISSVIVSLLAAGLLQALLGVYQFLTQSGPEGFVLHGRFMRAFGTFEQPNPYAGFLGVVAPLALSTALGLLTARSRSLGRLATEPRDWPRWLEWFSLAVFALLGAAIGMSWSRGAWIGFAAATIVVSAAHSLRVRLGLGALFSILVLAGLAAGTGAVPTVVTERLTSVLPFVDTPDVAAVEVTDQNYAALERLAHWQSALAMWRDHPWLGVGFGNYAVAYSQYALPKWPMALGHAHNYYLNVAAETGLLGLTAYLCLWGVVFCYVWRVLRAATDRRTRALALGALGMLVHVSVHNIVDNLWVHNIYVHVAVVLGLLPLAACRRCSSPDANGVSARA